MALGLAGRTGVQTALGTTVRTTLLKAPGTTPLTVWRSEPLPISVVETCTFPPWGLIGHWSLAVRISALRHGAQGSGKDGEHRPGQGSGKYPRFRPTLC
jgi:hypothetical protein